MHHRRNKQRAKKQGVTGVKRISIKKEGKNNRDKYIYNEF